MCAFDTNENSASTFIGLAKSMDAGMTWQRLDPVYSSSYNAANAHLVQCEDGTILCAFREVVSNTSFNIKLSASSDSGNSWHVVGTIDHDSRGLWEPFLLPLSDSTVIAFYSSEAFAPQYSQVIAQRVSTDRGRTWGQVTITTKQSQSRDGMPSVVKLTNGDWLCFFEATDEANPFVIKVVRSSDEGKTWKNRQLVYQPEKSGKLASAPWGILLQDQRLLCSFQTDEDQSDGLG
ncbi:MAG: exo-alpha-sialidase, partial [Calditrichaeota bacterium]|nr:exo-alpha-sialidase [Calditrichota bacterium]